MKNLLTIFSAFILLVVSSVTNADKATTVKNKQLNELAVELINGLDKYCKNLSGKSLPGKNLCSNNNKLRIALRPFSEEEIPIAQKMASKLNNEFLNHLLKISGNRYNLVTRRELDKLESEIYEFSGDVYPLKI